ncbi:MAG TPA: type II CAAX endopeptidase family protein [Pseudomonadales bacterium]|nr:type II CAAX endopeptidase family protein [Pseudomonadales bacterium]
MIGTSTEEVSIPEPRRPARYFSPGFTVFCTVVVLVLMFLYAAPWRGSPLDQLERPAESLERLVTRDLDVRDALRSAPTWEQRLYTVLAGADDPVGEALGWYEELLEVVDSERAALYHAILQAEAGEPAPDDEQADEAVVAAYSPQPVAPEEARALITRVRATLPQNWFTDTLVARIARKVGDLPTAERAEAAIVTRGRSLLGRWLGLTATELALIGATIALLVVARARGGIPRLGAAPLPPLWGFADGYALVVRGVLGLLGLTLVILLVVPDAHDLLRAASFAAGIPVILWTLAYLHARGESFRAAFGLDLSRRRLGWLLGTALVLAGVGGAAEAGIGALANVLGVETHWADGLPEDLLWDPPWQVVLGALDTVVWTPFVEELTFRGLLYGTLRTQTGPPLAAMASASIFAIAHGYGPTGFLSVLISGLLWAIAYERTRSLLPGILAHAANNLSVTVTYLLLLRF